MSLRRRRACSACVLSRVRAEDVDERRKVDGTCINATKRKEMVGSLPYGLARAHCSVTRKFLNQFSPPCILLFCAMPC